MRQFKYVFIIPLVLFIGTRLYFFVKTDISDWTKGDATDYLLIAENLSTNGAYSLDGSDFDADALWRPPLWPLMLSFLYKLSFGKSSLILFKMVFEIGLLIVLYLMVKPIQMGDLFNGIILSLFSIEPHFLKYSPSFLSENFTAILLVLFTGSFLYSIIGDSKIAILSCAVFGALSILSHPAVFVYVFLLLGLCFARMILFKRFAIVATSFLCFFFLLFSWPLRNYLAFNQGFFFTTSQGAVLSKSWNDDILKYFNNTKGDALDEYKNVSRYQNLQARLNSNPINNSKILIQATRRFVSESSFFHLSQIAFWKWYCGIQPFPQTTKPGFIEAMGSAFRVIYLMGVLLAIYALVTHRFDSGSLPYWSAWILILVFAAISMTSIVLYTGLRFNSVYGPVNLIMTLFIVNGFWKSLAQKDLTLLSAEK